MKLEGSAARLGARQFPPPSVSEDIHYKELGTVLLQMQRLAGWLQRHPVRKVAVRVRLIVLLMWLAWSALLVGG